MRCDSVAQGLELTPSVLCVIEDADELAGHNYQRCPKARLTKCLHPCDNSSHRKGPSFAEMTAELMRISVLSSGHHHDRTGRKFKQRRGS